MLYNFRVHVRALTVAARLVARATARVRNNRADMSIQGKV